MQYDWGTKFFLKMTKDNGKGWISCAPPEGFGWQAFNAPWPMDRVIMSFVPPPALATRESYVMPPWHRGSDARGSPYGSSSAYGSDARVSPYGP